jgi:hypothetical protein
MRNVQQGVVKAPNLQLQDLAAARSSAPAAEAAVARASNSALFAGDPGGSANLERRPSPVVLPSHRFNVADARMPQPPSAIEPGKGAIPVNPFLPTEPGIARARPVFGETKPR